MEPDSIINKLSFYATSLRERILLYNYQKCNPEVIIFNYTSWSGYSQYDASAYSGAMSNVAIEVKYREFTHDKFETTFLEVNKFEYMKWITNDFNHNHSQLWSFYSKDNILEVIDLCDPDLKYFVSNQKRGGKDSFQSRTTDESDVIEIYKNQPAVTYYKFPEMNYNALAIHTLANRFPNLRDEINKINLSKFQNYLQRKEQSK